jgi:hypothetical protein
MLPDERPQTRQRKIRTILSVPLSPEQRAELELRAGRQPLSAYARGQLFPANDNEPTPTPRKSGPVKDHAALARLLAQIGRSDMAASLRSLSEMARTGALPVTPETEAALQAACADIAAMKALLMKALGIRER